MGFSALIPLLVPVITELLKMLASTMDKKPPAPVIPATTPLTGMALGALDGLDMGASAALGMAGSAVYEAGLKPLLKKMKGGGDEQGNGRAQSFNHD